MAANAPDRTVPDLSFMLAHASHVLATRMTAAFAEIGVTPRDYCVLHHAASGELTQVDLARLSDLDKTTMVVTLDELEAAGYAERHPSPADRRARIVVVTDAGRRVVAAGHKIADAGTPGGPGGAGARQPRRVPGLAHPARRRAARRAG